MHGKFFMLLLHFVCLLLMLFVCPFVGGLSWNRVWRYEGLALRVGGGGTGTTDQEERNDFETAWLLTSIISLRNTLSLRVRVVCFGCFSQRREKKKEILLETPEIWLPSGKRDILISLPELTVLSSLFVSCVCRDLHDKKYSHLK